MKKSIKKECICCKDKVIFEVDESDYQDWLNGKHAQNSFPYLSVNEREILISGICGKCFDKMMYDR